MSLISWLDDFADRSTEQRWPPSVTKKTVAESPITIVLLLNLETIFLTY